MQKLLDVHRNYLVYQTKCATSTELPNLLNKKFNHDNITRFLNSDILSIEEHHKSIKQNSSLAANRAALNELKESTLAALALGEFGIIYIAEV
jgi:hypothetical protein